MFPVCAQGVQGDILQQFVLNDLASRECECMCVFWLVLVIEGSERW